MGAQNKSLISDTVLVCQWLDVNDMRWVGILLYQVPSPSAPTLQAYSGGRGPTGGCGGASAAASCHGAFCRRPTQRHPSQGLLIDTLNNTWAPLPRFTARSPTMAGAHARSREYLGEFDNAWTSYVSPCAWLFVCLPACLPASLPACLPILWDDIRGTPDPIHLLS